jgi:integrase
MISLTRFVLGRASSDSPWVSRKPVREELFSAERLEEHARSLAVVGLDVEHVTWTPEGMRLLIVRSKTDKEGAGAEIGIAHGRHPATCPVAALRLWLEQAALTSGPIFRKVDRWGAVHAGRLDSDGVRQILKKRAAQAKITGTIWEPVTPHGMRAGFVTTAYKNGVHHADLDKAPRHSDNRGNPGARIMRDLDVEGVKPLRGHVCNADGEDKAIMQQHPIHHAE